MSEGETQETFSARMCDVAVAGHTMVGLAVGMSLGLFDTMCQLQQPFTTHELAEKARCKERYIREWIHHMVVVDIVDVDESGSKFTFPEQRRHALTSHDQIIPGTASPFPYLMLPHRELLECIKVDGPNGLPFHKLEELAIEYKKRPADQVDIYHCVDCMAECISDIKEKSGSGITVCEVGSGQGALMIHLARQFSDCTFVGFELDEGQLRRSQAALTDSGVQNVVFHLQDACAIPDKWTSSLDLIIMVKVLHDISFPSQCASELIRCLKPEGKAAILEYDMSSNIYKVNENPNTRMMGQLFLPISIHHCLVSAMLPDGSEGLGTCVGKERLFAILESAGFWIEICKPMGDKRKCLILCSRNPHHPQTR